MNRIVDTTCTSFEDGFRISWEDELGFFGQINFYDVDGTLFMDSEYMGKEFVKSVLSKAVDDGVLRNK